MAKAITLYWVVLIPMDSAAISSSLIEIQALPWEELIKLLIKTTVVTVKKNNQNHRYIWGYHLILLPHWLFPGLEKLRELFQPYPRLQWLGSPL